MVLNYASQLISLFILGLSVSLLTINLRLKSFISISLDLILVSIKRLRVSALSIPYRPTPIFIIPTKGAYSR